MATLSPNHAYSHSSDYTSSSHAEALLSRARQLSSNAYDRSRAASPQPCAFAEGEDFNMSSPVLKSTSPYLSPTSSRTSASLHQFHLDSFNERIRDHRRRSSNMQRLSNMSNSSGSTMIPSPLFSEFPSDSSSPSSMTDSTPFVSKATTLMRINQQTSQGTTVEPFPGDCSSIQKYDDYKDYGTDTHTDCPTKQTPMTQCSHPTSQFRALSLETRENSPKISSIAASTHRKHRSDIGRGDQHITDILGMLRESEQNSSGTTSQSNYATSNPDKLASEHPLSTSFTPSVYVPRTIYAPTTDISQDQSGTNQQQEPVTSIPADIRENQAPLEKDNLLPAPATASIISTPFDPEAHVPINQSTLDQVNNIHQSGHNDDNSNLERSNSSASETSSHSRDSSSSTLLSVQAPKKERRSSRLLGKLLPKFMHTSHHTSHGSSSSSSTAPQSPNSASSPSNLSGGVDAGHTTHSKSITVPSPRPASPTLPTLPESVLGLENEWFIMDADMASFKSTAQTSVTTPITPEPSGVAPIAVNIRSQETQPYIASSSLSNSSRNSLSVHSFKIEESDSPAGPSDDVRAFQSYTASFKMEVEVEVEDNGEENDAEKKYRNEQAQTDDADYSSYSPYTIDEDCDDDFFRNSVLRKKTRPHSMLPSISFGTSWSSLEREPSLSTSFSSSQTSSTVPSPTTSYTPMPGTLSPSPVTHYGIDEKRSRLSDAVKEWRRSAGASLSSTYSMTYSGFST
ncbi:hypothetical protein BGZ46_004448 [Entomortierella lignicola]|nr:hypothetical protein BGZ46_004448 [Entomortierella lignicola]